MLSPSSIHHLKELVRFQERLAALRALKRIPGYGQVSRNRAMDHWQSKIFHALDAVVREELRAWSATGLSGLWDDCAYRGYHPTLPDSLQAVADYLRAKDLPVTVRPEVLA